MGVTGEGVVEQRYAGRVPDGVSVDALALAIIVRVYWRRLVVAWAISIPGDGDDSEELVEVLGEGRKAVVVAVTEAAVGATQHFLSSASEDQLDTDTEKQIRSLLQQLEIEYGKAKGPSGEQVRSFVAQIVVELIGAQVFGDRATQLIEDLGGRPPEAVAEVVEALQAAVDEVTSSWLPAERDGEQTVDVVAVPVTHVERAETAVGGIDWSPSSIADDTLVELRKKIPQRGADAILVGGGGTLLTLAVALADVVGVDGVVVVLHWLDALPGMRYGLTTKQIPAAVRAMFPRVSDSDWED